MPAGRQFRTLDQETFKVLQIRALCHRKNSGKRRRRRELEKVEWVGEHLNWVNVIIGKNFHYQLCVK